MSRPRRPRRGIPKSIITCRYVPCRCRVGVDNAYCSEYCKQAADHGTEREYCQCEHALCSASVDAGNHIRLPANETANALNAPER